MKSNRSWRKALTSKSFIYFFATCMSLILSVGFGIVYTQAAFSELNQMNTVESTTVYTSEVIVDETPVKKDEITVVKENLETIVEAAAYEIVDNTTSNEIAVEDEQEGKDDSEDIPVEDEMESEDEKEAEVEVTEAETESAETAKSAEIVEESAEESVVAAEQAVETTVEAVKVEDAKTETAKNETAKLQTVKTETTKAQTTKTETTKVQTAKTETAKAQTTKTETTKVQTAKTETAKAQTTKTETTKVEAPKVEEPKVEDVKVETVKTAQQIVAEEAATRGSYGRLYISSVGVDVAVFATSNMNRLQGIVDDQDSACMFSWYDGNTMIADHNYQGFDGIKSCVPGTRAEIVTPNGTKSYTCKEIIHDGWNTGDDLTYYDFTPISTKYTNNLVIYTCNEEGTITITIWG